MNYPPFELTAEEMPDAAAVQATDAWAGAPEWAQYWAIDGDGLACWYETQPEQCGCGDLPWGHFNCSGRIALHERVRAPENWLATVVERPQLEIDLPQPNWDEAPDWANYWAVDRGGEQWWYEHKPAVDECGWAPVNFSHRHDRCQQDTHDPCPRFAETLTKRPQAAPANEEPLLVLKLTADNGDRVEAEFDVQQAKQLMHGLAQFLLVALEQDDD